ncbi:MAG: hypothetical protein GX451_05655 [Acholeplasmataceae bacterium]|nr:hypothetical protein [Acholeplasmataceae bacterium]
MDDIKVPVVDESGKFSWPAFVAGLILGAFLFWLTMQVIVALMFSRTAA